FAWNVPSSAAAPMRMPSAASRQSRDGNVGPWTTLSQGSAGSVVVVGRRFGVVVGVVLLVVLLVLLDDEVEVVEAPVELVEVVEVEDGGELAVVEVGGVVMVDVDVVEVVVVVEISGHPPSVSHTLSA